MKSSLERPIYIILYSDKVGFIFNLPFQLFSPLFPCLFFIVIKTFGAESEAFLLNMFLVYIDVFICRYHARLNYGASSSCK